MLDTLSINSCRILAFVISIAFSNEAFAQMSTSGGTGVPTTTYGTGVPTTTYGTGVSTTTHGTGVSTTTHGTVLSTSNRVMPCQQGTHEVLPSGACIKN